MKGILAFFILGLVPLRAMSGNFYYPDVFLENLNPEVNTVYYGERKVILARMTYKLLKYFQEWWLPPGVQLVVNGGVCPTFANGAIFFPYIGYCYFSLIVSGYKLGQVITADHIYHLYGVESKVGIWNYWISIPLAIVVIPHPLSMANIPLQNGTADIPLVVNLKNYVNYYVENTQAGAMPYGEVTPVAQDGLYYSPEQFAIVGTPKRTGTYVFKIGAANHYSRAAPTELIINVGINPTNKPRFKSNYFIPSATPGQDYQLYLFDLIEQKSRYLNNLVNFRIDANEKHPNWLRIGGVSNHYLIGNVPNYEAGSDKELTIIASSNTGGDSKPLKISIPIATDPQKKSTILPFTLNKILGNQFSYDVRKHIIDPSNDANIKVFIHEVEPAAPWLSVSPHDPTLLIGTIPTEVKGREYQVTLFANTRMGGNSDLIKIPLSIAIDEEKTPRFKAANPQLPIMYPGQPFSHDFVLNRDVFPEYEDIPYEIELAEGYANPTWVRIQNNKIIADIVPEDNPQQSLKVYLTIKNIPGGKSAVIPVLVFLMN